MNEYYTYAYLREDGTPYYIGKGVRNRINSISHRSLPPKDRRIFLKKNLTNEEAIRHEIYMISILGRKDLGTGILRNLTRGGEGVSGWVASEEIRQKMRDSHIGLIGYTHSIESRQKMSIAQSGDKNHFYGKTHTDITKKKISFHSSKTNQGRKWYNNGEINKFCYECPKGFVIGMRRQRD